MSEFADFSEPVSDGDEGPEVDLTGRILLVANVVIALPDGTSIDSVEAIVADLASKLETAAGDDMLAIEVNAMVPLPDPFIEVEGNEV